MIAVVQLPADLERSRLAELEDVVERGLATFVEVGQALMEIRDARLYRESHATFEDYCAARWRFSKQYAHLVIAEAAVNQLVDAPIRQSHARELAPLLDQPEQLREAWKRAVATGAVTAAVIAEAAAWTAWEHDWQTVTCTPAPTLGDFERLVREACSTFGLSTELDPVDVRSAHGWWALEHAGSCLVQGAHAPCPPSFAGTAPARGGKKELMRRVEWELRCERVAGRILCIADAVESRDVVALEKLSAAKTYDLGWGDEDLVAWGRGHLTARLAA